MTSEGLKYDQQKPRMDLLDANWLESVAGVLTFGANKYTRKEYYTCPVTIVEEILKYGPEDYVKVATTLATNKKIPIPIIPIRENIDEKIKKDLLNGDVTTWLPILVYWKPKGEMISKESIDYQTISLILCLHNSIAQYVGEQINYALTTTTPPDRLEIDFVNHVTLHLDSLKKILGQLKQQSIYGNGVLKISGANNWRNGIAVSRLIAASYRHLGAINRGEDIDPESGLRHVDHLGCCVMFLSEMLKQQDFDDRYKENK